jgi:hypothetical protein
MATACLHREIARNTGDPRRWVGTQLDAREGQARPLGESDRLIVPWKPGNAGGGKGPDFGSVVEGTKSPESGHGPTTSITDSAVPDATRGSVKARPAGRAVGRPPNSVGEPDAGNLPVRFDEGEVETGDGKILGHRQPKGPGNMQGFPTLPRHLPTLLFFPLLLSEK